MTKAKASEADTGQDAPVESDAPIEWVEPVASYEAAIIDPEPEAAAQDEETQPEIPEGHAAIRYVGPADVFEHGAYQFRGGQPVIVPSEVAEELLTYPFERFERA